MTPLTVRMLLAVELPASSYHAVLSSSSSSLRAPRHLSVASPRAAVAMAVAQSKHLIGPVIVGGCAESYLESHSDLHLPRMCVVAKQPPLTDDAIETFLGFVGEVLDHGEPFSVLWNVEGGAFPSMKQFKRVMQYLDEDNRGAKWDALVQGNVAIIRQPLLRYTSKLFIAIAKPPQPSHVCSTPEQAAAFAKKTFTEAKSYS